MTPPFSPDYKQRVLARFDDDEALLREMVQLFLDDAPQQMAALRAAASARDAPAVRSLAHALKGAASNFQFTRPQAGDDDPAQQTAAAALVLERLAASGLKEQFAAAFAAVEEALANLRRRLATLMD
jgi:HPt (histidine-containing phosphotransfer) domain-containing protein